MLIPIRTSAPPHIHEIHVQSGSGPAPCGTPSQMGIGPARLRVSEVSEDCGPACFESRARPQSRAALASLWSRARVPARPAGLAPFRADVQKSRAAELLPRVPAHRRTAPGRNCDPARPPVLSRLMDFSRGSHAPAAPELKTFLYPKSAPPITGMCAFWVAVTPQKCTASGHGLLISWKWVSRDPG
jgi:hypothetical protein